MPNRTTFQKWQSLPPKKRMLIAFGGGLTALTLAVIAVAPSQPIPAASNTATKPQATVNLELPGSTGHDQTIEKLSASMEVLRGRQVELNTGLDQTRRSLESQSAQSSPVDPVTVRELQELRAEILALRARQDKPPSLDEALPPPQTTELSSQESAQVSVQTLETTSNTPAIETSHIRIIEEVRTPSENSERLSIPKLTVFIPAGTMFEGNLMNGMEAPTSGIAQKSPVPALLRVKSDAILPNRHRYDVRECFVIVSGYGVLSTERVNLQTVTLSCIKKDGTVIETKIEGYVVGEDGKVGMRGRLISKQGQIIAKSFAAGFFSSLGQAFTPTTVPQLNITPGAISQFQTPNLGSALTASTAQGFSQSSQTISKFYLDMAKEMFPVVSVNANRRVTIILLKGIELNMLGAVN